jgi:cytochrome c-type biogenesis protein CcmH
MAISCCCARPSTRTLALWAAPFLILLAALGFVWRRGRRMASLRLRHLRLSPEERKRLDALLQDERD